MSVPPGQHEGAHILVVDLASGDRHTISGQASDERSIALVVVGTRTLDILDVDSTELDQRLAELTANQDRTRRGWASHTDLPDATVILCTTGSCDLLPQAVAAVLAQRGVNFEVIVVDNAPHTGATRTQLAHLADDRLRIVDEPTPGLSRARNRGVAAAKAEIIAFTDDDALVRPDWLRGLIEPFADDPQHRIAATTGIVLPAELAHRSQRWFEARGGFPKDPEPLLWSCTPPDAELARFGTAGQGGPLHPFLPARVGAGVCMAFRAQALAAVGPFDIALGAGTRTRGGEDLDIFARLLLAGWAIVHTPDAVVHHRHRRDEAGLATQIRGNGSGAAALLTKTLIAKPATIMTLLRRIPAVARRLRPGSPRVAGTDPDVPAGLTKQEIAGFLEGPWLYLRSRKEARRRR